MSAKLRVTIESGDAAGGLSFRVEPLKRLRSSRQAAREFALTLDAIEALDVLEIFDPIQYLLSVDRVAHVLHAVACQYPVGVEWKAKGMVANAVVEGIVSRAAEATIGATT